LLVLHDSGVNDAFYVPHVAPINLQIKRPLAIVLRAMQAEPMRVWRAVVVNGVG